MEKIIDIKVAKNVVVEFKFSSFSIASVISISEIYLLFSTDLFLNLYQIIDYVILL